MPNQRGNRGNYKMKYHTDIKGMMPAQYHWLLRETSPRVLFEALSLYGIYEWRGDDHNPVIMQWAKDIGRKVGMHYTADEIPWCGLYVAICVQRAGFELPDIAVRAKAWLDWGTVIEPSNASLGDVLVFDRKGGGHVGFYVGEDDEAYHVLGGNQANQVNIRRMLKNRLEGVRRCPWKIRQPRAVEPIRLARVGIISRNEA